MTPAYVRKLARRFDAELSVSLFTDGWNAAAIAEDGCPFDATAPTEAEAIAALGRKLATAIRRRVRLDTKALAATVGRKGGGRW